MKTIKDIIHGDSNTDSDSWDVSWILEIKLPEDRVVNLAQAADLCTQMARAAEWCGEKIAIMSMIVEEAKDEYKREWSEAYLMRTAVKSPQQAKKVEADRDALYLKAKSSYNEVAAHLEWLKQKHSAFMTGHYTMKELLRTGQRELNLSGWDSTFSDDPVLEDEPKETSRQTSYKTTKKSPPLIKGSGQQGSLNDL